MAVFHVAPGRHRGVSDSESLEPQAPHCQASAPGIPGERLNPQVCPFYLEASNSIFPGGSAGKESACNAGDLGSIPGLGRSPGEGNGYPLRILACSIPWTEEPSRLQSMGLQGTGHD